MYIYVYVYMYIYICICIYIYIYTVELLKSGPPKIRKLLKSGLFWPKISYLKNATKCHKQEVSSFLRTKDSINVFLVIYY